MTDVLTPMAGAVVELRAVPDPVFASEMVGSGVAVRPAGERATAVAPLAGKLVKVHPHAFVVSGDDGAVLVHLGIDTIRLDGVGFEVHVEEGSHVEPGDPVVTWTPSDVAAQGLSELVLVCALDTPAGLVDPTALGASVDAGVTLFELPLS